MKATGIVRKVDELGRIVLPAELRRTLSIAEKDPLEIYVDGGSIILQKHEERCVFAAEARIFALSWARTSAAAACRG